MNVFVPMDEEHIYGVYATLEDALKTGYDVNEYILGTDDRIRGYTCDGRLWWENGRDIKAAEYNARFGVVINAPDSPKTTKNITHESSELSGESYDDMPCSPAADLE